MSFKEEEESLETKKEKIQEMPESILGNLRRFPTSTPSLVFPHGEQRQFQTFFNLFDNGKCCQESVAEMCGMHCWAANHGWLVMGSSYSPNYFLFNLDSMSKILLPVLPMSSGLDMKNFTCILTSTPTDPDCLVMFINKDVKSCSFCHLGDSSWIYKKLEFAKECEGIRNVTNAVSIKGKIYLQFNCPFRGIVMMDVKNKDVTVSTLKTGRPDPSLPDCGGYDSNLVESDGELLLVRKHIVGMTGIFLSFEVFKLDFVSMLWVTMRNLGNRIILLGDFKDTNFGISVCDRDLGVSKGDCIYFLTPNEKSLKIFDMENGTTFVTLPCPNLPGQWYPPYWVVPS